MSKKIFIVYGHHDINKSFNASIRDTFIEEAKKFIFDENMTYPYTFRSHYDLETWEEKDIDYLINTEFKNFDKNNPHEVFILRRKGLLKNQMKELCKV